MIGFHADIHDDNASAVVVNVNVLCATWYPKAGSNDETNITCCTLHWCVAARCVMKTLDGPRR